MFAYKSAPKVLLNLNSKTLLIIALEKMHIVGGRSCMGSLGNETQILYLVV